MTEKGIALLGRRDRPTDAVEEYCRHLSDALRTHGFELRLERVPWEEKGWPAAMAELRQRAAAWHGSWVLLQYTALAWSTRGFPLRFLRVLKILRESGVRIGIVYHDVEPYAGKRWVDHLRRQAQLHAMREALDLADLAILTVSVDKVSWIEGLNAKTVFIPVGANLTRPEAAWEKGPVEGMSPPTIAVYGITGGVAGMWEMAAVSEALSYASERIGKVRLLIFGRNSEVAESSLQHLIENGLVELSALGILREEEIVKTLGRADVLLFARGTISSRRGSAIAGIACGLPVVAFAGPETASPITEAGVLFAEPQNQDSMGEALVRILSDEAYRASLAEKSRRAQEKYFSWPAIAERYTEVLGNRNRVAISNTRN
jgi:glycosyltransferase involved in cell wall biosynthesis